MVLGLYFGLHLDLDLGFRVGVRGTVTVSSGNEWLTLVYGLGICGCLRLSAAVCEFRGFGFSGATEWLFKDFHW